MILDPFLVLLMTDSGILFYFHIVLIYLSTPDDRFFISGSGFQLSLVSVSDDMRHVIDTVTNTYNEYNDINNRHNDISNINNRHNNMADQQLVRHIIKLLSSKVFKFQM